VNRIIGGIAAIGALAVIALIFLLAPHAEKADPPTPAAVAKRPVRQPVHVSNSEVSIFGEEFGSQLLYMLTVLLWGAVLLCFFAGCLFIYILPSFIAYRRGHHNAQAIFILNVLLGWMLIGWVAAMVWAHTQIRDHRGQWRN
jgi:hypothetical protein